MTLFERKARKEGIFSIKVNEYGTYTFLFTNYKGEVDKDVTFALDVAHRHDDPLAAKHLDPVE